MKAGSTGEPHSGKYIDTSEAGRVLNKRLNLMRESLNRGTGGTELFGREGEKVSSVINEGLTD